MSVARCEACASSIAVIPSLCAVNEDSRPCQPHARTQTAIEVARAHTKANAYACVQVLQAAADAMTKANARSNAAPAPYVVFDQSFGRSERDAVDAFKVRASLTLFLAAAAANGDREVEARCNKCLQFFNSDRLAHKGVPLAGPDQKMLEVLQSEGAPSDVPTVSKNRCC